MKQNLRDRAIKNFDLKGRSYEFYSLRTLEEEGYDIKKLPYSIKVLLESVLRQWDGHGITEEHIKNLAGWYRDDTQKQAEVPFKPARVILQDFTGVPAVLDLAAMRVAMAEAADSQGGNHTLDHKETMIDKINPEVPVDLVIDHSVQVDYYGALSSLVENMKLEFQRNNERYQFLNWAKKAFRNFTVVPPATGIVHQVNLEYLAQVVITKNEEDRSIVYPDSLVGTDSHTTMINGLGVLGWGVGGIEAEAGMLGQPSYFPVPEVIGVKMTGELPLGATATDLALRVTQLLRQRGVVGKFVEYFGSGVSNLSLADRATVANMAPEYGATCGFFPVDEETLKYLILTGRSPEHVDLVREYLIQNDMFYQKDSPEPVYTEVIELDLSTVETSLSGPKRPQDLIPLGQMKQAFIDSVTAPQGNQGHGLSEEEFNKGVKVTLADGRESLMKTGSIAIASITSCTNTSNPSVMLGAGLLAKKAVEKGLRVPAHVKTSLAPGSKVVSGYLESSGLQSFLDELGFHIVGYGCATCIGNSGPLLPEITKAITDNDLLGASVLSGNRNFEGRIHPLVKANYLASPPLVVAYALAGTVNIDLEKEPLGKDTQGNEVYLKDIWPNKEELNEIISKHVKPELFQKEYEKVYDNNDMWNAIMSDEDKLYAFDETSTYIQNPPFFVELSKEPGNIKSLSELRVIAKFGDSITTDHISPAGAIGKNTPAGKYLMEHGVKNTEFNTYGSRRGNHEVMMRGTFANIRIRNRIAPETEGGFTTYWPTGEVMPIYDACMKYKETGTGLVVLAGKDYGMGSSRDWAAKGPSLLGVKVVIAESFERIHRSNLVMMGVLPLQFTEGQSAESLGLTGDEVYEVKLKDTVKPRDTIQVTAKTSEGKSIVFDTIARFDSAVDVDYYRHGGILQMVLRQKLAIEE
ncbi:aconitate hydratase AcnA [Mobilitalea sibirica]|uniref:Aconitate hydratase n=1 Tax=Mobilitalea sibirica TaxID=1462919 RepID=A0A8J7H342_9FIRM|nr:aconitate hydratase AcnA [Mobilitalea sibirica]MBH1941383.1 aconitate hydratase AcnA [Mobilitalea sibirica]